MANYVEYSTDDTIPSEVVVSLIMENIDANDNDRSRTKLEEACKKFSETTLSTTYLKTATAIAEQLVQYLSDNNQNNNVDEIGEYAAALLNKNINIAGREISKTIYDFITELADRIEDPELADYCAHEEQIFDYDATQTDTLCKKYLAQKSQADGRPVAQTIFEQIKTSGQFFDINATKYMKWALPYTRLNRFMRNSILLNAIITTVLPGVALSLLLVDCVYSMGTAPIIAAIIMFVSAIVLRCTHMHSLANDVSEFNDTSSILPIITKQVLTTTTGVILLCVTISRFVGALL